MTAENTTADRATVRLRGPLNDAVDRHVRHALPLGDGAQPQASACRVQCLNPRDESRIDLAVGVAENLAFGLGIAEACLHALANEVALELRKAWRAC